MIWLIRAVQGFSILAMLGGIIGFIAFTMAFLGMSKVEIESIMPVVFTNPNVNAQEIWQKLLVAVFSLFIGLQIYMFYRLFRLFGEFAAKRYFSRAAIYHMRMFAGLYVLLSFIFLVVTTDYRDRLFISSSALSHFVIGLIFLSIAYVLAEARKAHQELDDYF